MTALRALPGDDPLSPSTNGAEPTTTLTTETYTDSFGWSLDYPTGWYAYPDDRLKGRSLEVGAAFSNEPLVPAADGSGRGGPWPDLSQLSAHGGVLIVTHRNGGPAPTIDDDSSFQLQPGDAAILNAEPPLDRLLGFRGGGLGVSMVWGRVRQRLTSRPRSHGQLDPLRALGVRRGAQRVRVDRLEGAVQGGPRCSGLAGRLGVVYVFFGKGNTYGLDLAPDPCGEGENQTWNAARLEILIECPDGTEVRYYPSQAPASNPEGFRRSLAAYPLVVSWDGHLLVALDHVQQ